MGVGTSQRGGLKRSERQKGGVGRWVHRGYIDFVVLGRTWSAGRQATWQAVAVAAAVAAVVQAEMVVAVVERME